MWLAPLPSLGPFGSRAKKRKRVVPHAAAFVRLVTAWQPMCLMYHCAPWSAFGTVRCMW
jgi:hypothetical protein